MSSNSYYTGGNQQQNYGQQDQNASYGADYGQTPHSNYNQSQGYPQQGQSQGYSQQQGQPQTYAEQAYPDGSREQKYDQQGNPVLPNGDRGLLSDLAGAGVGAFAGHKAGGHAILGALAGGIGAHLIGDAVQKPHNQGQYPRPQQGGFGKLFGRRDMDGNDMDGNNGPGQMYPDSNAYGGQGGPGGPGGYGQQQQHYGGPGGNGGPGGYGEQQHHGGHHQHQHQGGQQFGGQGGGPQGFGGQNDRPYGQNYGQDQGRY